MSTNLKKIDARRRKLGISVQKLCVAAGIHTNTYRFALEGHAHSRPKTIEKLAAALNLLAAGGEVERRPTMCMSYLRDLQVQFATRAGWDAELLLAQNFAEECPNDPVWRAAARMRRCAIYLLVEGLKVGKAEIAHAIGITRQAVHKGVAAIEAERMRDEAFDAMMETAMVRLKGNQ